MLKDVPAWIQVAIALVGLFAVIVGFGVYMKDGVEHNNEAISQVDSKIEKVDDIVRDNQQRLAHIEALLEQERQTVRFSPRIPSPFVGNERAGIPQSRGPEPENDPYEYP